MTQIHDNTFGLDEETGEDNGIVECDELTSQGRVRLTSIELVKFAIGLFCSYGVITSYLEPKYPKYYPTSQNSGMHFAGLCFSCFLAISIFYQNPQKNSFRLTWKHTTLPILLISLLLGTIFLSLTELVTYGLLLGAGLYLYDRFGTFHYHMVRRTRDPVK
jgi:hypothetical protein